MVKKLYCTQNGQNYGVLTILSAIWVRNYCTQNGQNYGVLTILSAIGLRRYCEISVVEITRDI